MAQERFSVGGEWYYERYAPKGVKTRTRDASKTNPMMDCKTNPMTARVHAPSWLYTFKHSLPPFYSCTPIGSHDTMRTKGVEGH
jgi:hypothetical protein